MHRSIFLIVLSPAVALSSWVGAADLRPPSRQEAWKPGDSWTVRTWNSRIRLSSKPGSDDVLGKGSPIDIEFKVRRLLSTREFQPPYPQRNIRQVYGDRILPPEGHMCFEVEVNYPSTSPEYQQKLCLYFRQDTRNLIRIQDASGKKGEEPARTGAIEFSPDPNGPVIVNDSALIGFTNIFDFPDFTKDPNFSCEEHIGPTKTVVGQTVTSRVVKEQDGAEREEYEVTMTATAGSHERKTIQKWRSGDPWWYESRQFQDGKIRGHEAILVRSDKGQKSDR
jgi:hypothetical protein